MTTNTFDTAFSTKDHLPHDDTPNDIHSTEHLQLKPNSSGCNLFHNLAPELILEIAENLDPVAVKALRNVCRPFYHYIPPGYDWKTKSNRFKFAHLLDRDGTLETTAVCSECEELHLKACFSDSELRRSAERRQCEGSKRLYYFRPGFTLPLKAMRVLSEKSMFDRAPVMCFNDWTCAFDRVPYLMKEPNEATITISQQIEIIIDTQWVGFLAKEVVEDALEGLDVPICPHLRTSDPRLLTEYIERTDRGIIFDGPVAMGRGSCAEPHCRTYFWFLRNDRRYGHEGRFVMLDIIRQVGDVDNPNDDAWFAQTIPSPAPEVEERWRECYNHRDSRLQEGALPETNRRRRFRDRPAVIWAWSGSFNSRMWSGTQAAS